MSADRTKARRSSLCGLRSGRSDCYQSHLRLLRYPILGGERRAGDKGASKYDVMTDAAGRDGVGNISKGFLKKTARPAKSERTLRKALRDKRDALRAQGKPVSQSAWITSATAVSSKRIFFGMVGCQEQEGLLAEDGGRQPEDAGIHDGRREARPFVRLEPRRAEGCDLD